MNFSTQFLSFFSRACATLVMLLLFGCSGGGGGDSLSLSGGIGGTGIAGPVSGATVTAYAITNGQMGAQIATGTSDANGNFNLSTGSYTGPVMLQLSGGTYTDEATGTTMPMASGDVMTAALTSVTAGASINGVQITPLTSMAQAMAHNMSGGMTDANIAAANTALGTYFSVSDILHTVPINPLVTGSGAGASQSAKNYGMTLAAISQYAQTQGMSSSSAMITAMMNDASDGVMNGMMGSSGAVMMGGMGISTAMPTAAGMTGMGGAMSAFVASAQNKSGVSTTAMQTLMSQINGSNGQMLGSGSPVIVNASVSGTAFNGVMSKATVRAYAVNNGGIGAQIASVSTGSTGTFTLPLGSYTGPVMVQVSGGTYTDPATGNSTTMAATDTMTTVMPSITSGQTVTGIWVTPQTSMAQTRAQALSGGMTDANIAAANTVVGNYFSVSDILHTQPIDMRSAGSGTASGVTPNMQNYGAAIAAMSQYAQSNTTAVSSTFVTAMMNDATDGTLNGKMGATQITMPMSGGMGGGMNGMGNMVTTAGTSGLATAMNTFLGSAANQSGLSVSGMLALYTKLNGSNGTIQ